MQKVKVKVKDDSVRKLVVTDEQTDRRTDVIVSPDSLVQLAIMCNADGDMKAHTAKFTPSNTNKLQIKTY